jgi:hypothetical protein
MPSLPARPPATPPLRDRPTRKPFIPKRLGLYDACRRTVRTVGRGPAGVECPGPGNGADDSRHSPSPRVGEMDRPNRPMTAVVLDASSLLRSGCALDGRPHGDRPPSIGLGRGGAETNCHLPGRCSRDRPVRPPGWPWLTLVARVNPRSTDLTNYGATCYASPVDR